MSAAINQMQEKENKQQSPSTQENSDNQEDVQISPPRVERAEGPFEHSGETSGWTEEEKVEKEESEGQKHA